MQSAFQCIMVLVIAGSCAAWVEAFRRIARQQPWLPRTPRRPVPWGLVDLLLATALLWTFQVLNAAVLNRGLGIDPARGWDSLSWRQLALVLVCDPVANLTAIAVALAAIRLRTGTRGSDYGFTRGQVWPDVKLGLVAFVMLAPPVYGLQRLLTLLFPYDHPLLSALDKHSEPLVHAAVFFSAVVAAPLVEEFFYRVLWQGWLQAFLLRRGDFAELVFGSPGTPVPASPDGPATHDGGGVAATLHPTRASETLAILISSAMFASMHVSQGPAPIPLFVLALGLGFVYARTGRVLPCIVIHVLLNACTLATLWVGGSQR